MFEEGEYCCIFLHCQNKNATGFTNTTNFQSNITNDGDGDSLKDTYKTINIIQSSFILFFNLLLFLFIISRATLRKRLSNQFFVHLQLIHMTIGLLRIISCYRISVDVVSNVLLISMFNSLVLTSADRLAALKYPMKYKLLTSKMVVRTLVLSWIPSILFSIVAWWKGVSVEQLQLVHTSMIAIAATVLLMSNVLIFLVVKDHQAFLRKNTFSPNRNTESRRRGNLKASYICIAIVMNFIVCWIPHCVHDLIELTSSSLLDSVDAGVLDITVKQLTLLNSLSDPILFICLSTKTQQEIRKLFTRRSSMKQKLADDITSTLMATLNIDASVPM